MGRPGDKTVALLWDESFLWGVMAYRALAAAGLPFRLLSAADLKAGMPGDCAALFVPGGWASNKMKAIGSDGAARIRDFVAEGGAYVGFCGGAGLATDVGLALVDARRRPTKERVPSFSGPIRLVTNGDQLWEGISDPVFDAWWPSQLDAGRDVSVLATYGEALPGAFSSDLNVGDTIAAGGWKELEARYAINLDRSACETSRQSSGAGSARGRSCFPSSISIRLTMQTARQSWLTSGKRSSRPALPRLSAKEQPRRIRRLPWQRPAQPLLHSRKK